MDTLINLAGGDHITNIAFIFLVFLLAGTIKGVVGLGLPTVAVGLLSLFMTSVEASALLIIPSLFTNVWQAISGSHLKQLALRLWSMLFGVCIGTWGGTAAFGHLHADWAAAGLGFILMIYAILGLAAREWSFSRSAELWLAPIVGVITGGITAVSGVFVIPAVPFLQALGLPKSALLQAMGLAFTVSTVALAVSLACTGNFHPGSAAGSSLALLPTCMGMAAGQWLRNRMKPAVFKRCFFFGLLLLGCYFFAGLWLH